MKPVIYQIFVRLFGNSRNSLITNGTKEENGCGKFCDISDKALRSLKEFGISHVWYTGVIEHAVASDYSCFGIDNDYPEIVKGRAGSPYAIKDYYDVNPDLAVNVNCRMDEFEALVNRTHNAGMKVVIDLVPNHVARVYRSDSKPGNTPGDFGVDDNKDISFSHFSDFYYIPGEELKLPDSIYERATDIEYRKSPEPYREYPARATGNDCFSSCPGENDWYETVKLNYGIDYSGDKNIYSDPVPPVWKKMRSIVLFWAGKNIDGFRVDMAEMVPLEFWEWLIPGIKKEYPEIIFIAEIYQPSLYKDFTSRGGFDYLYDKAGFYDRIRNIIENKADTGAITEIWQQSGNLDKHMLRFLENHDEQRVASRFFAGDPWKALPGMVLAATMNKGPLMLYFGQEVGEPAEGCSGFSGDDGRTTIFDYWYVPNHQKWMSRGKFNGEMLPDDLVSLRENYAGIIKMVKQYDLFSNGSFYDLMWVNTELRDISSGRCYAFLRHLKGEIFLIVLNFGETDLKGLKLVIPEDAFDLMQVPANLNVIKEHAFPFRDAMRSDKTLQREGSFRFDAPSFCSLIFILQQTTG